MKEYTETTRFEWYRVAVGLAEALRDVGMAVWANGLTDDECAEIQRSTDEALAAFDAIAPRQETP